MLVSNATSIYTICRDIWTYLDGRGARVDWTVTNLAIQVACGLLGAHIAATAVHEHRFGLIGHSLVGLIAGAASGWLLQTQVATIVTGSGSLEPPRPVDVLVIEAMTGAVVGGIAMLGFGLIFNLRHHRKDVS